MIIFLMICLVVICAAVTLFYGLANPKPNNKGQYPPRKYQYFVTYFISLLSVFVGAFLGFQLSDLQTHNNEKSYLLDLISRTATELKDESSTMKMSYDYYTSKPVDEAEKRMNANSVQDVFGLYILIDSPEFSKYITPVDGMLIQQDVRQKEKVRAFINNPNYKLSDRIDAYQVYSNLLGDIELMLNLESDFIKRKISYKQLLDSLSKSNYINNSKLPGYFGDFQYGTDVPLPKQ